MSIELQDTLSICRQIRNNDRDSGTHYLLGYLWANTPDKEKERIAKENELKLVQAKYDNAIAKGDSCVKVKSYDMAKTSYTSAASLKPKETIPAIKIKEVVFPCDEVLAFVDLAFSSHGLGMRSD